MIPPPFHPKGGGKIRYTMWGLSAEHLMRLWSFYLINPHCNCFMLSNHSCLELPTNISISILSTLFSPFPGMKDSLVSLSTLKVSKEKSHIGILCTQPFATPCTVGHHGPLSIKSPRQDYWSGLPFPSPRDLPDPGIKSISPAWQADSLLLSYCYCC